MKNKHFTKISYIIGAVLFYISSSQICVASSSSEEAAQAHNVCPDITGHKLTDRELSVLYNAEPGSKVLVRQKIWEVLSINNFQEYFLHLTLQAERDNQGNLLCNYYRKGTTTLILSLRQLT